MKKKLICAFMMIVMICSMTALTGCGSSADGTDQEQATEETVQAADPMTDEEMENDDADGCIEDSEDLLY